MINQLMFFTRYVRLQLQPCCLSICITSNLFFCTFSLQPWFIPDIRKSLKVSHLLGLVQNSQQVHSQSGFHLHISPSSSQQFSHQFRNLGNVLQTFWQSENVTQMLFSGDRSSLHAFVSITPILNIFCYFLNITK